MKDVQFQFNGQVITAQLGTRVEKKALYGYASYMAEEDGVPLKKGYLNQDGKPLQRCQITLVKMDTEGSQLEEPTTEINGTAAELIPRSFDRQAALTQLPLKEFVAFVITDAYAISTPAELPAGLYGADFNYRKSAQVKEALLLARAGQSWLLLGTRRAAAFVGQSVAYSFFDLDHAVGDEEEDRSFSMN